MAKFKILNKNDSCIFLKYTAENRFMIRDIENDVIYMGSNYEEAERAFNTYDINEIRKERRNMLDKWLHDFAE